MPINLLTLTEDQQKLIMENYDKMALLPLTQLVFNNPDLDGRSLEGRTVKTFLADQNKTIKTTKYERISDIPLTDEQKEVIKNLLSQNNSSTIEIARIVFNNEKIVQNTKEFRTIYQFIKAIDPNQTSLSEEMVDKKEYFPPKNPSATAKLVNDYVPTGSNDKKFYDVDNLKPKEEKSCRILMSYLQSVRFVLQASGYDKRIDRELFESEFVRFTYNKEDLTKEEQTQYISLCAEIVSEAQTNRILSQLQYDVEEGLRSTNPETRRYSQSLAENVNAWRQKLQVSKQAQQNLLEKLTESRAQRLEGKLSENSSVLSFLDLWINEENRRQLIDLAKKEKTEDHEEYKRLKSVDDMMARIFGQTEEETKL